MDYLQKLKHLLTEQEIRELAYDVPFVPSSAQQVKSMLQLADIKPGMVCADLGSGNGQLVIKMAQAGGIAHGFEIDPGRVALSKRNVLIARVPDKAFIHHKSFWNVNLGTFDVITIYGIGSIMKRLEEKLRAEIKPTCKIVSNTFKFPTWEPVTSIEQVHLYRLG